MSEITIPPYGYTKIGPIYFRPPSRGYYNGCLQLENSLTGYETLKIQGMGDMGKIIFYDNAEKENRGTDIEMRNGHLQRQTITKI
jgi:hypothetical protein